VGYKKSKKKKWGGEPMFGFFSMDRAGLNHQLKIKYNKENYKK